MQSSFKNSLFNDPANHAKPHQILLVRLTVDAYNFHMWLIIGHFHLNYSERLPVTEVTEVTRVSDGSEGHVKLIKV